MKLFVNLPQESIPCTESSAEQSVSDEQNCDHATNDMSSADKTPQTHLKSPETGATTAQTAEEDEDEERKTNHLYPYSSMNNNHNHYHYDDDDDCNSSEETKPRCPSECVSLNTEQHNGQQKQVGFGSHHPIDEQIFCEETIYLHIYSNSSSRSAIRTQTNMSARTNTQECHKTY